MTTSKENDHLDSSDPEVQKKNSKFDQERADSLDHAKQSGKGKDGNALTKPASEELPKP